MTTASPRRHRRLLAVLIVLTTLFVTGLLGSWLVGCAAPVADGEGWNPAPTHHPLPPHYIASDDVESACGFHNGLITHGCARRDYASNLCVITTGPNPPAWLRAHEEKHCAGFDHPAPHAIPSISFGR